MYLQGKIDEAFGAEFTFDIHVQELVVGEIFVRIYNEQPTFPLEVSKCNANRLREFKQKLFFYIQGNLGKYRK